MKIDYIGYALAVLSLMYAYYLYRKGLRIKEPVFSIKSVNVISDFSSKYQDLTVSYKGEKVENFTVSKILFYNRGADTITRQDIETLNRLRIMAIENRDIIDASILQVNNPSNDFKINLDRAADSSVSIEFDYLDKNHGAVVQIMHTGLSSDDIQMVGDIKGVQKLSQLDPKQLLINRPMGTNEKRILWIIALITLIFLYFTIFAMDEFNLLVDSLDPLVKLLTTFLAIIGFFGTIGFGGLAIISFFGLFAPDNKIPRGLEKFDE